MLKSFCLILLFLLGAVEAPAAQSLYRTVIAQGVPAEPLAAAFRFMNEHVSNIQNLYYLTLVDFSEHISVERMYVIDLVSGRVDRYHVAHGQASDPWRTGYAEVFSNIYGSEMSSLGYYLTLGGYDGKFGRGVALKGLSASNSNAYMRQVVLHAWFVGPEYQAYYGTEQCPVAGGCLTQGCFGVSQSVAPSIIERIKGGSILFAFTSRRSGVSY